MPIARMANESIRITDFILSGFGVSIMNPLSEVLSNSSSNDESGSDEDNAPGKENSPEMIGQDICQDKP